MSENSQRPILGVSAVVFHQGKVLLVKRGKNPGRGLWSLPGGKVEFGETVRTGALREVLEETDVRVQIGKLVGIYDIVTDDAHFVIACFTAVASKPTIKVGGDADDAAFFGVDELKNFALAPNTLRAIEDAQGLIQI